MRYGIYIIAIILALLPDKANAQVIKSFGIKGGGNVTKLDAKDWDIGLNYKDGVQFGIFTEFKITDKIALGLEFTSIQKNIAYKRVLDNDDTQLKYWYALIPVYLNVPLDKKQVFSVNAGLYYEKASIYPTITNTFEKYKKSGIGGLVGLRVKTPSYHSFNLFVDIQGIYGLSPVIIREELNKTVKTKYIGYTAAFGIIYNLSKKNTSHE